MANDIKKSLLLILVYLIIIFIIDINTSLSIAVGVFYLPVFFFIDKLNSKLIIYVAFVVLLVALIKPVIHLFSYPDLNQVIDRVLVMCTLLAAFMFTYKGRIEREYRLKAKLRHINNLEEMLFKTNHEIRSPLARCMGIIELIKKDDLNTAPQIKIMVSYLEASVVELDEFVHDLNDFLETIKSLETFNQEDY